MPLGNFLWGQGAVVEAGNEYYAQKFALIYFCAVFAHSRTWPSHSLTSRKASMEGLEVYLLKRKNVFVFGQDEGSWKLCWVTFKVATWQAGQYHWARWGSSMALKSANLGPGPCWEDGRLLNISIFPLPSLWISFASLLSTHHALNRIFSLMTIPWSEPGHPHFTDEDTETPKPAVLTQGHRVRNSNRFRFPSVVFPSRSSLWSPADKSIILDAMAVRRDDICKVLKSYTHVRCSSCYR